MKRITTLLISLFALISLLTPVLVPSHAGAVDVLSQACNNNNATEEPTVCKDNHPDGANPFFGKDGVVTKGIQIFSLITGVTAVIVLMVSGIRYMTTQGDPQSVATAQRSVIYAIVGLVIAASAQLIVSFVLTKV